MDSESTGFVIVYRDNRGIYDYVNHNTYVYLHIRGV